MLFENSGVHFNTSKYSKLCFENSFDVINFLKELFLSPNSVQLELRFIGMARLTSVQSTD